MANSRPVFDELIVVFTHNDDDRFLKHTGGLRPGTNLPILSANTLLIPINDKKNFTGVPNKELALDHSFYHCRAEVSRDFLLRRLSLILQKYSCKLVTLVIDFNLGYSGNNLSPVKNIQSILENNAREYGIPEELVFIKSASELVFYKDKSGPVPFRFVLTGSGGSTVASASATLEAITHTQAYTDYSYNGWNIFSFMGALRKPGVSNPSPVPVTPVSTTRRLAQSPLPPQPKLSHTTSSCSATSSASSEYNSARSTPSPHSLQQHYDFSDGAASPASASSTSTSLSPMPLISRTTSAPDSEATTVEISQMSQISVTQSNCGFFGDTKFSFSSQPSSLSTVSEDSPEKEKKQHAHPTPIATPGLRVRRLAFPASQANAIATGEATEVLAQDILSQLKL